MKPLAGGSVAKRSRTRQLLVTYRDGLDGSILAYDLISARQPAPEVLLERLEREIDALADVVDRWSMAIVAACWLPRDPITIVLSGMALEGMDDIFTALFMGTAVTMTYDGVVSRA